ncbi:MAG TPA: response regulator, partial [Pseudomonadota bacterium]|nr:response regulator [Pseudomonadota bacterium]
TSAAILHALGHRVVSVATGEAVLAAYRSAAASAERFDLAILDLTIRGGMGGMETLRALRALDKDTRAILTSGYSDDVVSIGEHPFQAKYFLPKPYTMNQLRDMILALMEDSDHAA